MLVNFIKSKLSFLWLIIYIGFLIGVYSFLNIPKEATPSIKLPIFIINTSYPGGNPTNIEKNITNKLEDEFKTISGIEKIESVSNFNFSTIILKFKDNKNIYDAKLEINQAINNTSLPSGASVPNFKQVSPDDSPIYSFSISGNYLSKNIYEKVKDLEDSLKSIEGISEVKVIGKPKKNINIYIDEKKLNEFKIDIANVKKLLSGIFINQAIGKKDIGGNLYGYELETFENNLDNFIKQIEEIDLINNKSQSIKIKDIASVFMEEESKIEKSFVLKGNNSINSISFDIKANPGEDAEKIIKNILKKVNEFKVENKDLEIFEIYSKLTEINDMFGTFLSNFWQSGLIIMIILFLFIGFRISLGVTIAFPLVYMTTFIFLFSMNYSFNNVVSFGLVLTLGIMVDNLIVVTEGLVNELKVNKQISFWEALGKTYKSYNKSIIAGTLTTIVMFVPLIYMLSGVIGQFISPLSITVITTLITSIFVAILLLPIILKKILRKRISGDSTFFGKKLEKVSNNLGDFSKIFLKNKLNSLFIVIGFWLTFAISLGAVGIGIIKTDFLPATDQDNIWINIKYPTGFSVEKNQEETNKILIDIKGYLEKNYKDSINYYYINIGNIYSTSALTSASNITSDNQAYINIKLNPGETRKIKSFEINENLQNFITKNIKQKYNSIKDIYTVSGTSMSGGKDVGFFIVGNDLNKISSYIKKVKPEIEKIKGIYNLTSSLEYTSGKIKYFIDINKANRNGISIDSIITLISSIKNSNYKTNGVFIKDFREFGKDDVSMFLLTNYQGSIEDLKIGENFVSFATKEKKLEAELKNIQHRDSKMQIGLEADKKSNIPLGAITEQIDKVINNNPLPEGLKFIYNSNISDQAQSMKDLGLALGTGIFMMLIILVFQFNSFSISLIVLTSTLLSIIGVIIFLGLFGLPLSFPAQIGLFGVIGVGVNNSILFTDLFREKEKIDLAKDLTDTIKQRFPAIFLTTLTTIAGLITLALKDELWGSLAIAFIGGLILNIFIVLIYLPSFYFLISKQK
ncbi:hypothetical protein DLH72_00675 [Candidatus Gracilibacteria bacterium]|nr:MAG: hypothetical protein DLH72_00675 [Candidatus Gracilibacteria bacterium]